MQITLTLNGIKVTEDVAADMLLIDFVRAHGCKSVKRGCETSNCGLCTVFLDEKPVLFLFGTGSACQRPQHYHTGRPAGRSRGIRRLYRGSGCRAVWLLQPGLYHERAGPLRENPYPSEEEVKEYLSGNLCRCSGYEASCAAS